MDGGEEWRRMCEFKLFALLLRTVLSDVDLSLLRSQKGRKKKGNKKVRPRARRRKTTPAKVAFTKPERIRARG